MGDLSRANHARDLNRRRFILLSASAAAGLAVAGCAARRERVDGPGPRLITTLGELALPDAGIILPHEHIFLDLRLPSHPQYGQAQIEDVVEVMQPELERARAAGVAVLVDAAPLGMGRRADIIVAVSRAARLPVLLPTGLYCDQFMPDWARAASEEDLRDWMVGELIGGIEETRVKASWIKLCTSPDNVGCLFRSALVLAIRRSVHEVANSESTTNAAELGGRRASPESRGSGRIGVRRCAAAW
jgi:predicted metal-dependent phosphotriesterase family hydrolase